MNSTADDPLLKPADKIDFSKEEATERIASEIFMDGETPREVPIIKDESNRASPTLNRQCRICFDDDEADPELGRLISPCRCRGSMRYVHIGCLQQWRQASGNNRKSFYQCDQCQYKYRLQRLSWAKWLQNEFLLSALTVLAFFLLIVLSGYLAKGVAWFMDLDGWVAGFWEELILDSYYEEDFEEGDGLGHRWNQSDNPFQQSYRQWQQSHSPWQLAHIIGGAFMVGLYGALQLGIMLQMGMDLRFNWHFGGGNRRGNGMGAGTIILLLLVAAGVVKSVQLIYRSTRAFVQKWGLDPMESLVLDVPEDLNEPAPERFKQD